MKIPNIFKYIMGRRRTKKAVKERLHYIENIKPIQPNRYSLDECTVTRDK